MDINLIERLIELVGRNAIEELEVAEDGWRIRIVRTTGSRSGSGVVPNAPTEGPVASFSTEQPRVFVSGDDPDGYTIGAPLAGVFYASRAPGEQPFVAIGDDVEEGQTLGILEAMKTLNPIEADAAGRVVAILETDGATVASGTPLFRIAPTLLESPA